VTYQPYPSADSYIATQLRGTVGPPQPRSLRNAVRLMWAGAGVAVLTTIVEFAVRGRIRALVFNGMRRNDHHALTVAQLHQWASGTFAAYLVAGVISVFLWVWMAWANNRASGWARIVATVFCGVDTIFVFVSLHRASVSILFLLAQWLIGVAATALLWQRETTQFIGPG
jgi:hypothetical protein